MSVNESEERKVLHDIAGPLGTAMFLLELVVEIMNESPNSNPEGLEQIGKVGEALEKAKKVLHERREVLIKRGVPSSRG